MTLPEHLKNDELIDEPTVQIQESEFSFLPPVHVSVTYENGVGSWTQALHLTWTAAQDLYQKLGEHLRQHTGEEI